MATANSTLPSTSNTPSLIHVQTLATPTAGVRTWSSQPHPSPNTPLLATAASDRSVNIWDMRDWKLLSTIAGGHKRSVRCVGWKDHRDYDERRTTKRRRTQTAADVDDDAGDGSNQQRKPVILATGSFDANCGLWVWNRDRVGRGDGLTRDQQMQSVPGAFGGDDDDDEHERDFTRTAGNDNEEEDDEDWHFSTLLTGPDSEIKDLQFSPAHYGANLLATCSRDKSVWVWEEVEPEEWETVAVLSEHTGDVKCVGWLKGARTTKEDLRRRLKRMEEDENGDRAVGEDEEEEIILGGRELLATGSYDDTIRLHHDDEAEGDWITIAVITGHDGTVWDVKFETFVNASAYPEGTAVDEVIVDWAPRLISCSDDMTIRLWKKKLSDKEKEEKNARIAEIRQGLAASNGDQSAAAVRQTGFASTRIPSVIRPPTSTEKWVEEGKLPSVHVRSIYAIDWSERTGLVVSCGGDGIIAVYQETAIPATIKEDGQDTIMNGTTGQEDQQGHIDKVPTHWKVVALIEDAHDEYEVNHVCWAPRRDLKKGGDLPEISEVEDQEYIISTGDDGQVRVWRLPQEVMQSSTR